MWDGMGRPGARVDRVDEISRSIEPMRALILARAGRGRGKGTWDGGGGPRTCQVLGKVLVRRPEVHATVHATAATPAVASFFSDSG